GRRGEPGRRGGHREPRLESHVTEHTPAASPVMSRLVSGPVIMGCVADGRPGQAPTALDVEGTDGCRWRLNARSAGLPYPGPSPGDTRGCTRAARRAAGTGAACRPAGGTRPGGLGRWARPGAVGRSPPPHGPP